MSGGNLQDRLRSCSLCQGSQHSFSPFRPEHAAIVVIALMQFRARVGVVVPEGSRQQVWELDECEQILHLMVGSGRVSA